MEKRFLLVLFALAVVLTACGSEELPQEVVEVPVDASNFKEISDYCTDGVLTVFECNDVMRVLTEDGTIFYKEGKQIECNPLTKNCGDLSHEMCLKPYNCANPTVDMPSQEDIIVAPSSPEDIVVAPEVVVEEPQESTFTRCEIPRPEVCTREYAPVCGSVLDTSECPEGAVLCGKWSYNTFSNGCSACAESNVPGYTQGACAE